MSRLMALEPLLGQMSLFDDWRSNREPDVHPCVLNHLATDFEIWPLVWNLGLDLAIREG
jgi:hypothetical protein